MTVDVAEYAKNDDYLAYASKNLHSCNSDWLIRERCRAREDFENHERNMQLLLDEKDQIIAEKEQAIAEKERAIAEKTALIKELEALQNY